MATKGVSAFRLSDEAETMLDMMAAAENRNRSNMADVAIREAFAARKMKLPNPLPPRVKKGKE